MTKFPPASGQASTPKRQSRPSRNSHRFKKTEGTRAVRAVLSAGLAVARVEFDPASGMITVIAGEPQTKTEMSSPDDELERWREKKNAG